GGPTYRPESGILHCVALRIVNQAVFENASLQGVEVIAIMTATRATCRGRCVGDSRVVPKFGGSGIVGESPATTAAADWAVVPGGFSIKRILIMVINTVGILVSLVRYLSGIEI